MALFIYFLNFKTQIEGLLNPVVQSYGKAVCANTFVQNLKTRQNYIGEWFTIFVPGNEPVADLYNHPNLTLVINANIYQTGDETGSIVKTDLDSEQLYDLYVLIPNGTVPLIPYGLRNGVLAGTILTTDDGTPLTSEDGRILTAG